VLLGVRPKDKRKESQLSLTGSRIFHHQILSTANWDPGRQLDQNEDDNLQLRNHAKHKK